MKRKNLKNLLALCAALFCGVGVMACAGCVGPSASQSSSNSSVTQEPTVTLVNFKDETQQVGYGKMYTLDLMAEDAQGGTHAVKAEVKTASGEEVDVLNGKFIVLDKGGYVIQYSFTSGTKTQTRKVTLQVVALGVPVIEVDGKVTAVVSGKNYVVPTCTAMDYYDGALTATTSIYQVKEGGDVKKEYDAENGVYTTSEAGEYYVLYTAENSNKVKGEKKLTFYVRESAEAGEWDSFDDVGCVYTTSTYDGIKKISYLDSYKDRNGVVCLAMKGSVKNYTTFWSVEPKSTNLEDYENYKYIAVSAYIEGSASDLLNVRFMTNCTIEEIKANEWATYYFDASSWLKETRWTSAIGPTATKEGKANLNAVGSVFGDVNVYLDSIYFVNEIAVDSCSFTESEDGVTPTFTASATPDSYKVTFNGKDVSVYNGKFKADYAGEYVVQPVYTNSDKISFQSFVYQSTGEHSLALNEYDKAIGAAQASYVLPDVTVIDGNGNEVEGYSVTKKVVYTDTAGVERAVLDVNQAKKGWYTYTFTAKKEGAKLLEKTVTVKVGDFLKGEILNVADTDAPKRFSSMFTGGTFEKLTLTQENNETEKLPVEYVGDTFVKLAYNTQYSYTTNNSYINFNSVMTKQEINDCTENKVNLSFYVKASLMEGEETAPEVKFNFLGETVVLKLNAMNTIDSSYATLLAKYNKLATHTTWADYAIHVNTDIRKFAELTFYFESIVMHEETDLPYAVRVTAENKPLIYNKDIPNAYVAADADEISGFTGGYTGSAVKMYVATNPGYNFKNIYKPSQLAKYAETYNTVSLWLAVDGITESGTLYFWQSENSFITTAASNKNFGLKKANNGQWMKFSISMKEYIAMLEKNNYEYCNIGKTGVDGGALTSNNAKAYFYVGNIEFSYVKPDVLLIDETNYASVYLEGNAAASSYTAAGADNIKNFTGGYTGNATKLTRYTNNHYRFKNPYSLEELGEIKKKYNKVSLWLSLEALTSGSVRIYDKGGMNASTPETFLSKAGWAGWSTGKFFVKTPTTNQHLACETWHKISISIDDYISLVTAEDGSVKAYCPLMAIGQDGSAGGAYFYVGDITFEE